MSKTIADIFNTEDLEDSLLIGYYGGGNFGDELLLEVLMNLFTRRGVKSLTVTYQHPQRYKTYHHEFNYQRIDMANKLAVLRSVLKNKNIVIGGGGLWGLDVNPNIFLLSSLLFVSHFILRKRVYLLGVGYYSSTSRLGHLSAWLAGKSASHIVVRDQESLRHFKKISRHVTLDSDIAFQIPALDLAAYDRDRMQLDEAITITDTTLIITLRRFKPHQQNDYTKLIESCLTDNPDMPIIVGLLEPRAVDAEHYSLLVHWKAQYPNVQIIDFSYNPLALFLFFRQHHTQLALISPQFHAIIMALLTNVPFLPVVYDNKVIELLKQKTSSRPIQISDLTQGDLQSFIDNVKRLTE